MKVRSGLHRLLRQLAESRLECSVYAAALAALIRERAGQFSVARPVLSAAIAIQAGVPKLRFWAVLARSMSADVLVLSDEQVLFLRLALSQTAAFDQAVRRLKESRVLIHHRSQNYPEIADRWLQQHPRRLFVFHHFDRLGFFPSIWFDLLVMVKDAGWTVLVSTCALAPAHAEQLERAGFHLALRKNVGRCLGAYKDLSLLLHQNPGVASDVQSLVLANDSTLPLLPPEQCVRFLQSWSQIDELDPGPVLAGLTDSAERDNYHLQSFFLYANRALVQHPAWLRFWLGLSLDGTKDDLINRGEIGLSQAMLAAGVQLRPAYPLVEGLLADPAMAEELQSYGIWQPRHVNQSLFAWQSLLARGFPLVKKHVLFEMVENHGLPMAMADLARWIPEERRELLAADLHQLFVSRYSGGQPER